MYENFNNQTTKMQTLFIIPLLERALSYVERLNCPKHGTNLLFTSSQEYSLKIVTSLLIKPNFIGTRNIKINELNHDKID
jgi:hypothetical protein